MNTSRRYDIDWLRVIAIALLLIYHVAIGFQPWGIFIGFIKSNQSLESVWVPMSALNIWRIPFLFFVSGMGVWFAIQRRNWKQLIIERSQRILLPFIVGMVVIVPVHLFIWQQYYHQDIQYIFNPGHLWFLGNIFTYVVLLAPVFFYLKRKVDSKFKRFLNKVLSHPLGLSLLVVPFIAESEILHPESFEMYAMTWHGYFLGFIAFFLGFCCVYIGETFWRTITQWRWGLLLLAFSLYLVRVFQFDLRTPDYLMSIESCLWIFSVFAFGHKHLNKSHPMLTYLSQAAYPVYIVHMIFLYAGSYLLFTLNIPVIAQYILLNVFTFIGSLLFYEFVIRRIGFLRPLFGLKVIRKVPQPIKIQLKQGVQS